jgi:cupin fold WbuC family metalloprotein
MNPVRSLGPHAFESCLPFASLDRSAMQEVAADAVDAAKLRSRVCCHRGLSDSPQEMIICLEPRTYIRPHRHFGRAESGLGLRGAADAVFFNEDGAIQEVWPMGTYESGLRFFYRIQEPVFHCLLVRGEPFVFHEVSTGPFSRESTEFAPWSPPEEDAAAVGRYLDALGERVEAFYREHHHG